MNKIIIASDSFKGTLSSNQIIDIFKNSSKRITPKTEVIGVSIADGGEGTVDAFSKFFDGKFNSCESVKPDFKEHKGRYFLTKDIVAFLEVASSTGLNLCDIKDPSSLTSYGTGLEILDAIKSGAKRIILGLGGSATNDGGCGILTALGAKFLTKENIEFIPVGKTLKDINSVDLSGLKTNTKNIEFILLSDCENPLLGSKGCAKTYAKQKGADDEMIQNLEINMEHFYKITEHVCNNDFAKIPGAGAAGGIGFGLMSYLNAKIQKGIDTLLDFIKFDDMLKDCDYVFTGEGKLDEQSMQGKVISGIIKRAKKHDVPCVAVVGGVSPSGEDLCDENVGLNAIFSTSRLPIDFDKIQPYCAEFYKQTIDNILRLIVTVENKKK